MCFESFGRMALCVAGINSENEGGRRKYFKACSVRFRPSCGLPRRLFCFSLESDSKERSKPAHQPYYSCV